MRGSMRERSPGYWQLRVFDGADTDPVTGEKRYRNQYFRGGKREAQRQLAALVTEVDSGVVAPAAKTVATLLEEWLDHIDHLGRVPTTLYGFRRLVAKLPDGVKALPLKKITPMVVDDHSCFLAQPVDRKAATSEGIFLAADEHDLDELIGCVAAEANHEHDPRRRKRLDHAFEVLSEVLE